VQSNDTGSNHAAPQKVRRDLVFSPGFDRAFRRCIGKNRAVQKEVEAFLERLADDAFEPRLKTHKLKGELTGLWAASAGYDRRIIFRFVQNRDREAILLLSVGTHDDVY
jgi:mRNA-degrading endonuclease YafQ of YafQ-DinJ toxin-antitoxin module